MVQGDGQLILTQPILNEVFVHLEAVALCGPDHLLVIDVIDLEALFVALLDYLKDFTSEDVFSPEFACGEECFHVEVAVGPDG